MNNTIVAMSVDTTLKELEKKSSLVIKKLECITINSKEDFEKVAEQVAKLKAYKKEAEEKQSGLVDPAMLIVKNARALFKPFLTLVDEMEKAGKLQMLTWVNKNELKARQLETKFDNGEIKKVSTLTSKTTQLRDTSSANSSLRKVWQLTILDEKKLPRKFLAPDETLIKEALKNGEVVPGCEWKQVNSIAI